MPFTQPPFIPDTAPFSEEQRAYLNGLLAGIVSVASTSPVVANPPASLNIAVLYASQSGTAETLARKLTKELKGRGHVASLASLEGYTPATLAGELIERRALTCDVSSKLTMHCAFSIADSKLEYEAGDACGVLPQNDGRLVNEILDTLKFGSDVPVQLPKAGATTLWNALATHLQIPRLTRKTIAAYATISQSQKLFDLLMPEQQSHLDKYTHDLPELSNIPLERVDVETLRLEHAHWSLVWMTSLIQLSAGALTVALLTHQATPIMLTLLLALTAF